MRKDFHIQRSILKFVDQLFFALIININKVRLDFGSTPFIQAIFSIHFLPNLKMSNNTSALMFVVYVGSFYVDKKL